MRERLFIDTWGWVVILNKREPRHAEIEAFYKEFRFKDGAAVYTADYVLDETFTLLFKRLPFSSANNAISILDKAVTDGYLVLEWISPQRFEKAKKLRLSYQDKPDISFTDLTSMAVMNELGLKRILTDDEHFIHVGMNFEIMP